MHAKHARTGCASAIGTSSIAFGLHRPYRRNKKQNDTLMSIDTYRLTSMEEPTDEVLAQLMHEAAEEASRTNREATTRFFEEIKQAAAAY